MNTPIWKARIENGELLISDDRFHSWLKGRKKGDYEVIVRKIRKMRSGEQNSYLWAVPYELIGSKLGWSPDEVHEHCKSLFLQQHIASAPSRPGSTKDLTTIGFKTYIEKIQAWASEGFPDPQTGEAWPELSVYVPDPNEVVR